MKKKKIKLQDVTKTFPIALPRLPNEVNVIDLKTAKKMWSSQAAINSLGMILKLECGQRVKRGLKKTCRGRIRLTTKGNLRCAVCRTKWVKGY